MAMPLPAPLKEPGNWTIDDLERLPSDGNRYEIIDGVLFVSPSPTLTHQRACLKLYSTLQVYLDRQRIGEVFLAPADLVISQHTVVEPDLMVLPTAPGRLPPRWNRSDGVLLAVEVLSPSSARTDRQEKRKLYLRERIPEYWIVDLDARVVERWRPEEERPDILVEHLTWLPATTAEPFTMALPEYFARVWGEA